MQPPAKECAPCDARDELIAELEQAIEELKADLVALAEEVRLLRRRLRRNSRTSSLPPSADDLPGRPPPRETPPRWKQ